MGFEEAMDGEKLRTQHQEDLAAQRQAERDRREQQRERNVLWETENREQLRLKAEIVRREKEEEARIEAYARDKLAKDEERRLKAEQMEKKKQEIRQRLIDVRSAQLQAFVDQEDTRIETQVAVAKEKRERREEDKRLKQETMRRQCDEHRAIQLERQRIEREAGRQLDWDIADRLRQDIAEAGVHDREEKGRRQKEARDIQSFRRKQIRDRRRAAKQEKEETQRHIQNIQNEITAADSRFEKYTKNLMSDYTARGQNTGPLASRTKLHTRNPRDQPMASA